MGFNRKHSATFCETLKQALISVSPKSRQVIILSVIHQVLLQDRDVISKWERMQEFRVALSEITLLPVLAAEPTVLAASTLSKLQEYLKEWDEANVFSGPTLIGQLQRKLQQALSGGGSGADQAQAVTGTTSTTPEKPPVVKQETPEAQASSSSPVQPVKPDETVGKSDTAPVKQETSLKVKAEEDSQPLVKQEVTAEPEKKDESALATTMAVSPSQPDATKPSSSEPKKPEPSSASKVMTYDFDSKGIPEQPVDPKLLLEYSREVATLQIARDLRNDTAVQLSSLLSAMPEDVRRACAEAAEHGGTLPTPLSKVQARDFSKRTNEAILEMDLDEQYQNVTTFSQIVQRQRQARQHLIQSLIQSRCKFGADEAAEAFYQVDHHKAELMRRRQILIDAMELEGLDVENQATATGTADAAEDEVAPLSWYPRPPDAKRTKVE